MDVKYHLRGRPVGTGTLKNLSINLKSSRSTTARSSKRRHSTAHALSTPIPDIIQERHGRLLISDPAGTLQESGTDPSGREEARDPRQERLHPQLPNSTISSISRANVLKPTYQDR